MKNDHLKKLSKKEAFAMIGLHPKDEKTYFLANLIIVIENNGLSITKVSGKDSDSPEDTYSTNEPFIFTHNFLDYIIKNENKDLVVYEKEKIIGG